MRLRLATVAIVLAATGAAGGSATAFAATVNAQVHAKVIKPLALQSLQNMDLGTLLLGPGNWSGAIVSLSQDGTLTCPANVTCSGAAAVAQYRVSGSNNETVVIDTPDVTLVNQSDLTKTLALVVEGPTTIVLTNSSPRGTIFSLGGSITVDSTTADGNYSGTFDVTVDYQ